MALKAVNITIGTDLGGGAFGSSIKGASVPNFATVTTDLATVSTDVATLVADGASPTQGHVTTLNTHLGTLNTDYTALAATIAGDVSIVWNTSTITTKNQLRAALQVAMLAAESGIGALT